MKNFNLKYGSGKIAVSIPEKDLIGVLSGRHMEPIPDPPNVIFAALKEPINCPPLSKIVKKGEKVAIVVSDYTRATKADVFLPILVNHLNELGIPDENIFIVFATGTHPPHTREKQEKIVGSEIASRIKMYDHECKDESQLIDLGTTSRGTPVKVNKKVYEADRKILTGSITYHYFAGFGGGRKSVLPGICGYESIQTNHRLSMNPKSTTAALDDNPLSLDMEEAAQLFKPDFILNTVLNENKELCGVFAGDLIAAHRAGCQFINEYAMVRIEQKADLIVASSGGGGMDINYVQSHKAMENAHFALKDGGVMILLAEASEGFPSEMYEKYIKFGSGEAIHKELDQRFTIPGHTVFATFWKSEKYKIIWVTKLPKDIVKSMKITPADSFAEAYSIAEKWLPANPKTYVMPVAYTTFPVVS
ncbi:MAG: nickel-dependent lactate racemase [Candidatus Saganbacteria bacterium]|nr:nickel-dependent lactate racemase [Candidatus Saganbacteria bacterium]